MRGKFILTLCSLFCLTLASNAQINVKDIEFESEVYDFGTVSFGSPKINATFIFTNNSDIDFSITDVQASCGCTVPSWPETPIKPGMKGVIQATFDPTNLGGEVDKSIQVFGNFQRVMSKVLYIRGTIEKPQMSEPGKTYPGQYGYIRQSRNTVGFGEVLDSKSYTQEVLFVNDYNQPLRFTGVKKKPEYITYELSNEVMQPGDTVILTLTLHGDQVDDFGLVNDDIVFTTDDRFFKLKALKLAFSISKDFSQLSKREIKNAPKILIDKRHFELGSMKEGTKVTKTLTIKNTGKRPLEIYKVDAQCGCTALNLGTEPIQPGETREAQLTFDSIFITGMAQKTVIVYTNDPSNPVVHIGITAEVLEN